MVTAGKGHVGARECEAIRTWALGDGEPGGDVALGVVLPCRAGPCVTHLVVAAVTTVCLWLASTVTTEGMGPCCCAEKHTLAGPWLCYQPRVL